MKTRDNIIEFDSDENTLYKLANMLIAFSINESLSEEQRLGTTEAEKDTNTEQCTKSPKYSDLQRFTDSNFDINDTDLYFWIRLKLQGFAEEDWNDYIHIKSAYPTVQQLLENLETPEKALYFINNNDNISVTPSKKWKLLQIESNETIHTKWITISNQVTQPMDILSVEDDQLQISSNS